MRKGTERARAGRRVPLLMDQIRALAVKAGPDSRLPTTRELCSLFRVSSVTLNTALNELESASVVVRKDRSGLYVSPFLHQRRICIILGPNSFKGDDITFWSLLVRALNEVGEALPDAVSFHFSLSSTSVDPPLPRYLVQDIATGRVHGVMAISLPNSVMAWLNAQQCPCVTFACYGQYMVEMDNNQLLESAVQCLVAAGCRKIAYWYAKANSMQDSPDDSRDADFADLLRKYGVAYIAEFMQGTGSTDSKQQIGYDLATSTFAEDFGVKPDGIVIEDDMITQGALVGLTEMRIKPGTDVIIATHANEGSRFLFGWEDHVIRVEFSPKRIAQVMFDVLDSVMDGKQPAEKVTRIAPCVRT